MPEKLTYEEVRNQVKNLGYKLISDNYIDNRSKLTIQDKEDYLYYVCLCSIKSGYKPNKFNTSNIYTLENIRLWIKNNGNKYILISDNYDGATKKIILKDLDGYYYSISFSNLQNSKMPKFVHITNNFSIQNIQLWLIKNKINLTLLNKNYLGSDKDLFLKDDDGYVYTTSWDKLYQNKLPNFVDVRNKYSIQNINLWISKHNKNFILVSKTYNGVNQQLQWKCLNNDCEEYFYKDWSHIYRGQECPFCNNSRVGSKNNLSVTHPHLISEWDFLNNKISPTDITYGSTELINWVCNNCGHHWRTTINSRTSANSGCPECASLSKGRDLTKHILEKLNVKYIPEFRFNDCRDRLPLPFDFYLIDYNICIEIDGTQHRNPTEFFGGIEKFEITKLHDNIKTQYCDDNNINLIRIKYKRIEDIIKNLPLQLIKFNIIQNNINIEQILNQILPNDLGSVFNLKQTRKEEIS